MKKILTMMIVLLSFSAMAESKNCQIQVDFKLEDTSKEELAKVTMKRTELVDQRGDFSYNLVGTSLKFERENWKITYEGDKVGLFLIINAVEFDRKIDTLNINVNSHINISHGIGFSKTPLGMKATSPVDYYQFQLDENLDRVSSGTPFIRSTQVTVDCK